MCGKWALFLALSAILNPGDEVLYLEPVWVSYPPMIVLAGGTPVAVTLSADDNFALPLTSGNAECRRYRHRPNVIGRYTAPGTSTFHRKNQKRFYPVTTPCLMV